MNPQQIYSNQARTGFQYTPLGWIPVEWKVTKLGELTNYRKGFAFKSEDYKSQGVRVIRVSDTTFDSIKQHGEIHVSQEVAHKLSEFQLKIDDIIVATVGSKPPMYDSMVGKAIIVKKEFNGALLNQNAVKLYANSKSVSYFLYSHLKTKRYVQYIETLVRGNANQASITLEGLFAYEVPLPPLAEQRQIAAVLGTWDRAIEQTTDLLRALRLRHRGLMQRLLTGKVRLPGFADEWKHVEFGDVFERVNRRNAEGNTNVLTISAQQGLVSQGRYFNKNIASEIVTNYFLLYRGEFAYNKSYSAGYPMGVLKRLEQYEKGILSPLYICFRVRVETDNDATFFTHYFESGCLNQAIGEIAQEGARNHGLLNIGVNDFFALRLVVPTVDEQRAIARVLDASLREIRQHEAKLDTLREQKRGLMQSLLTGRVRVPDAVLTAQEAV